MISGSVPPIRSRAASIVTIAQIVCRVDNRSRKKAQYGHLFVSERDCAPSLASGSGDMECLSFVEILVGLDLIYLWIEVCLRHPGYGEDILMHETAVQYSVGIVSRRVRVTS